MPQPRLLELPKGVLADARLQAIHQEGCADSSLAVAAARPDHLCYKLPFGYCESLVSTLLIMHALLQLRA